MSQDRANPTNSNAEPPAQKPFAATHYGLLGLHPAASVRDIRQAYRELSKLYHPDTTNLGTEAATQKFQQLNEAYAILSSPDRRSAYDLKIGYSRVMVVRTLPSLNRPQPDRSTSSAYLDATDRPLSAGELFALFILGITFVGCLILAITIGLIKGEAALQPALQSISGPVIEQPPRSQPAAPAPKTAPSLPHLAQFSGNKAPKIEKVNVMIGLPSAPILPTSLSETNLAPTRSPDVSGALPSLSAVSESPPVISPERSPPNSAVLP